MINSAGVVRFITVVLVLPTLGCDRDKPEVRSDPIAVEPLAADLQPASKNANTAPSKAPPSKAEQARAKLGPLKTNLKAALMAAAQGGHLEQAVTACQVQAPVVTGAENKDSVKMGRSALKLRNPDNVAPPWVAPLMEELSKEATPDGASREVSLPEGRFGYVEAITTMPMCEGCHGTQIDEAITAKLNELYPQDEATGFSTGSFRGVFWVELPAK